MTRPPLKAGQSVFVRAEVVDDFGQEVNLRFSDGKHRYSLYLPKSQVKESVDTPTVGSFP